MTVKHVESLGTFDRHSMNVNFHFLIHLLLSAIILRFSTGPTSCQIFPFTTLLLHSHNPPCSSLIFCEHVKILLPPSLCTCCFSALEDPPTDVQIACSLVSCRGNFSNHCVHIPYLTSHQSLFPLS